MIEDEKNIYRNIETLRSQYSDMTEKCFAHFADLAKVMADLESNLGQIQHNEHFLSEYRRMTEELFTPLKHSGNRPSATQEILRSLFGFNDTMFKIYLAKAICDAKSAEGFSPDLFDFIPNAKLPGSPENKVRRISYLKNSYADSAFRIFAKALGNAAAFYPPDFGAVCEDVYYGRSEYCILPFESSEDGELKSFKRLAAKYDLYPVLMCSVEQTGMSSATKFALFGKNPEKADVKQLPKNCELHNYLVLNIGSCDTEAFGNLMLAANINGLNLLKIQSQPKEWYRDYSCELYFSADNCDAVPFLMYTVLEIPDSSVVGLYADISEIE